MEARSHLPHPTTPGGHSGEDEEGDEEETAVSEAAGDPIGEQGEGKYCACLGQRLQELDPLCFGQTMSPLLQFVCEGIT